MSHLEKQNNPENRTKIAGLLREFADAIENKNVNIAEQNSNVDYNAEKEICKCDIYLSLEVIKPEVGFPKKVGDFSIIENNELRENARAVSVSDEIIAANKQKVLEIGK